VNENQSIVIDTLLEAQPKALTLSEVTQITGLNRKTTYSILQRLVNLGLVVKTDSTYLPESDALENYLKNNSALGNSETSVRHARFVQGILTELESLKEQVDFIVACRKIGKNSLTDNLRLNVRGRITDAINELRNEQHYLSHKTMRTSHALDVVKKALEYGKIDDYGLPEVSRAELRQIVEQGLKVTLRETSRPRRVNLNEIRLDTDKDIEFKLVYAWEFEDLAICAFCWEDRSIIAPLVDHKCQICGRKPYKNFHKGVQWCTES